MLNVKVDKTLKDVLKDRAAELNMSMYRFVKSGLDIEQASLSMKLTGKRPFSLEEAHAIAALLGTSIDVVYLLIHH